MTNTHRTQRLAVAFTLVLALLASPAAATQPAPSPAADATIVVPQSKYNARWPREPASGPLPPVVAQAPDTQPLRAGTDRTLVSVAAGLLLLAAITGVATGVRPRLRTRSRRRVGA
jgi:hypothetical protein